MSFQVYPATAKFLNSVTKQVDVDVLDNLGNKVDIQKLAAPIEIIIQRMKHKDPAAVNIPGDKTS